MLTLIIKIKYLFGVQSILVHEKKRDEEIKIHRPSNLKHSLCEEKDK